METFLCHNYQPYIQGRDASDVIDEVEEVIGFIDLKNKYDIEILYKLICDEDNFIIDFENEDSEIESLLIVSSSITSRIKDGTFKLKATKEE